MSAMIAVIAVTVTVLAFVSAIPTAFGDDHTEEWMPNVTFHDGIVECDMPQDSVGIDVYVRIIGTDRAAEMHRGTASLDVTEYSGTMTASYEGRTMNAEYAVKVYR